MLLTGSVIVTIKLYGIRFQAYRGVAAFACNDSVAYNSRNIRIGHTILLSTEISQLFMLLTKELFRTISATRGGLEENYLLAPLLLLVSTKPSTFQNPFKTIPK